MSYVLILGANSDMAKASAIEYAKHGYDIYLAGRTITDLEPFAQDLRVKTGRIIKTVAIDILQFETHQQIYQELEEKPEGVLTFIGYLGDPQLSEQEFTESLKTINSNFTGLVSFLNIIATEFEQRKSGFIVGVSSVAGDRGRASNYIYGSAKAGFTAYLSGLRNRLFDSGVHVLTVKPGFVATRMTENMDLPDLLTAQPEEVAKDIFKAQQKKKNIIYTKWYWRIIMRVIKTIPESIFKRLSL